MRIAFLGLLLLTLTGTARADERAPDLRDEHQGLYVDLTLGWIHPKLRHDDLTASGSGSVFQLAAGWSVARNTVAFARYASSSASDFELSTGGSFFSQATLGLKAAGVGARRYLWRNFFVESSLDALWARFEDSSGVVPAVRSSVGPRINAALGKEWRRARGIGLGLSIEAFLGAIPRNDQGWTGLLGWSLLAHVVYN